MLMVVVGMVVLMVVVGVVVLMIVFGVVCLGAVEVDCSEVIDTFMLGGVILVIVLEVELGMECVVKLLLWCSNGRGNFL